MGVYVHWPFCLSKCPYCDFNVHVRDEIDYTRWQVAYIRALEHYSYITGGRLIRSIFFGGGTPSTMPPEIVKEIIDAVRRLWPCVNDFEVTLEANPTSIEVEKFEAFRDAGVNRVSVGVQALNDDDLKFLGREHDAAQARFAIDIAQKVFERFSFDLIYARPEQSLKTWQQELEMACKISSGHMSLYQLTIERNTPFYFAHEKGDFSMLDESFAADFYLLTQDIMEKAGMPAYEVSNHSFEGHESEHNLIYWHYGDYIGVGPGAHGRLSLKDGVKVATRAHHAPDIWLERVENGQSGAHPYDVLSPQDRFVECLMMGLRVVEGVPFDRLNTQGTCEWQKLLDVKKLDALKETGDLDYNEERIVLTMQGRLRLNAIIPYILK